MEKITSVFRTLKRKISLNNPLRLWYHKLQAVLALLVYRFPSEELTVICVTGTNGKTTTCNLIAQLLTAAGYRVGMTSTVMFKIGEKIWSNNSKMTTLGPWFMQRMLRQMVKNGCQYAVLETSSHALVQHRLWGVNYDVAVVTNVTKDHLDLHGTLEHYIATKERLFSEINLLKRKPRTKKISVINLDDPVSRAWRRLPTDQVVEYSLTKKADVQAVKIEYQPTITTGQLIINNEVIEVAYPLPGEFNLANLLAAVGVVITQKVDWQKLPEMIQHLTGVPGRLEVVKNKNVQIIIDYAHTGDALEKLLTVFNRTVQGRIILVFGATGERDVNRRVDLAQVAHKLADLIIVTDDDAYAEDHLKIIKDIEQALPRQEGDDFWIIPDREEAIKTAIMLAQPEDMVILAGKGGENVQVTNHGIIPWSDRQLAEKYAAAKVTK